MALILCQEEINWLKIPTRVSAIEVAKKIRLPLRGNVLEKIDLRLTPYLPEPISLIGNYKVPIIGIIAPTQSGKTVFLQVAMADAIDQDPGTVMYILPDEKAVRKAIDDKIRPLIERSPDLACHMTDKVKDMSISQIRLDHMTIYPAWAGSLASMSSVPCKRVFWDEVRLMPLTQGGESNAIKLGSDRLTTYMNYNIAQGYMVSSPSIEGDLLHQQLFVPGTLFVTWAVPCEKCHEFQVLDFFRHMKDIKTEPKCICEYCGAEFTDDDFKQKWNSKGRYVILEFNEEQKKWIPNIQKEFDYTDYSRVFFHYDSMVSPFRSFKRIAKEYIETKDRMHDYKNFIQCWLAKFWIDDKSKSNQISLSERKDSSHLKGEVPSWVKMLTCGIDTQDTGLYCVTRGWGSEKKTILIDEFFLRCDKQEQYTDDARELKILFERDIFGRIYRGIGKQWKVAVTAIDTGGHRTRAVYLAGSNFRRLIMVKGASRLQNATITFSKVDGLYLVRTDEYLEETDQRANSHDFILPDNVSKDYLSQFCNKRRVELQNKKTGELTVIWKQIGQCDFRMAEVHAFICLDIPSDRGVFRARIEEPDFKFNPVEENLGIQQVLSTSSDLPKEEESNYDIGEFQW